MLRILVFFLATLCFPGSISGQVIQNGDVNGDHARDIGDVVYQLSYLFLSGPPPVEIPPYVQDLDPASSDARFVNNGDGTWTDLETRLVWITGYIYWEVTHPGYSDPADYFNNIQYAGSDQWRLPKPQELMSLVPWGAQWRNNDFKDGEVEQLQPIWEAWGQLVVDNFGSAPGWPYGQMRITVDYPPCEYVSPGSPTEVQYRHLEWELNFPSSLYPGIPWRGVFNVYFTQKAGIAVRDIE